MPLFDVFVNVTEIRKSHNFHDAQLLISFSFVTGITGLLEFNNGIFTGISAQFASNISSTETNTIKFDTVYLLKSWKNKKKIPQSILYFNINHINKFQQRWSSETVLDKRK